MTVNSSSIIVWHIADYETESFCSGTDEYYLERLFFGVESHDINIIKNFSDEHLRHLCRIRRLFDSEWSAPAKEKQTAYQRACLLGYTEIVQYMLKTGIKIDQEFSYDGNWNIQRSAFMFACHSGSMSTMHALLQAISNDYMEHYKSRNRMAVCSSTFAKQYFIPQGRWVEQSSSSIDNNLEFVFPIHFAIARNNLEMARLLVTSSIGELETRNSWKPFEHGGFTPLHIACLFNRSLPMIELLLSFGEANANPLLQTNNQGMFADQMTNDRAVIEYLRPKRLHIINAQERERLKDLEEMKSGKPYEIFIKPLSGRTLTLTVTGHTTTAEIGEYLQNLCGLPPFQQKLLFHGRMIPTWGEIIERPLLYYDIKKDSIMNIIWHNPK